MRFNKQKQIDSLKRSIQTLQEQNKKYEEGASLLCRLFDNSAAIIPYPFKQVYVGLNIKFYKELLIYTYKGELKTFGLYTSNNLVEKVTNEKIIIKNEGRTFTYDKDAEVMVDITEEMHNAVSDAMANGFVIRGKENQQ